MLLALSTCSCIYHCGRSVRPSTLACRLSSSTAAIFFLVPQFSLATPSDTLDHAAIFKFYDFCIFYFDRSERSARGPSFPFLLPSLHQSSRSHAPQRGPRVTWRRLVKERKEKGLVVRGTKCCRCKVRVAAGWIVRGTKCCRCKVRVAAGGIVRGTKCCRCKVRGAAGGKVL